MSKMKDQAVVCNIGHFDNEIQVDPLNMPRVSKRTEHQSRQSISIPSKTATLSSCSPKDDS